MGVPVPPPRAMSAPQLTVRPAARKTIFREDGTAWCPPGTGWKVGYEGRCADYGKCKELTNELGHSVECYMITDMKHSVAMLHLGKVESNDRFKILAKEGLSELMTDTDSAIAKNKKEHEKLAKSARIFTRNVLNVMQGKGLNKTIDPKLQFSIVNRRGEPLSGFPINKLDKDEKMINEFLRRLYLTSAGFIRSKDKYENSVIVGNTGNSLVVGYNLPKKRRLLGIHRLFNEILDANGL